MRYYLVDETEKTGHVILGLKQDHKFYYFI